MDDCALALAESMALVLHEEMWRKVRHFGIGRFDSDDPLDSLQAEPVVFLAQGRFEFARDVRDATDAKLAVLLPARDECGDLADIAAWLPDTGKIALWRGAICMLGQDMLYDPRLDEPLLVHETIANWLRRRRGVFILDHRRAAVLFASLGPTLGVKSESFGRRLRTQLIVPSPKVLVAQRARAA